MAIQQSLPTGAAKPNAAVAQNAANAAGGEMVTYLPREGDPPQTRIGKKTFHANIAVKVDNPILLAKLKGNPWFHVGEGAPLVKVEPTNTPKTAEQYRAHAVAWLKTVTTVRELDDKWAAEELLRMECGVGADDLAFLGTLFAPRKHELTKAGMPD